MVETYHDKILRHTDPSEELEQVKGKLAIEIVQALLELRASGLWEPSRVKHWLDKAEGYIDYQTEW
jgi:hypothetical protein